MKQTYDLIVFDWDGTLIDSQARIINCMHAAIDAQQLATRSDDELKNVIGLGLREAMRGLFPDTAADLLEQLAQSYREHYLVHDKTPSPLFAGSMETLHRLQSEGYLLAIATGKGRQGLNQALKETGLDGFFHTTRCADETQSKPHPRMLLEIMEELNVTPAATLMVGDTEYDLQMAKRANAASVAVSYGVHERERLLSQAPHTCIDRIEDLCGWLKDVQSTVALD